MKRLLSLILAGMLLTTLSFAQQQSYVPSYYPQSDFLGSAPGAAGDGTGGFFNPAVWGMMKGPELHYYWNDLDNSGLNRKNWTMIFGGDGIGFTVQNWEYGEMVGGNINRYKLTDYQIALGGGDQENSFGIGYTWSRGTQSLSMPRANILSFGTLHRPNRYVSNGFVGHWAMKEDDFRGVMDLGIRPLGTPMLTLFGDATMETKDTFEDIEWAAGASIEPIPGVKLFGKMFHGGSYSAGLTFSISGFAATMMPHYDEDGEQTYNTYGVRVGFPKPDLVTPLVMKEKFLVTMPFNDRIKYQRYLFFDKGGYTLIELLENLETIKNDDRVDGLVLKITEEMSGTPEMIWEVREKMLELKADGKKIYVFFERGGMYEYYLASVGDKIMVDPLCNVTMLGFNFGRSYYKDMLEKLGIGFDEWRFMKYKSAMEGFSRTDMSEGDEEQLQAIADGWYDTFRSDICASRNISTDEFDYIVDEIGFLNPDSLIHYGLVDTTGRWDDMKEMIDANGGKDKTRIPQRALTAMTPIEDEWGLRPEVAVIYGLGPCAMNYGLNARKLAPAIKAARDNKRIKAVVFRADSPGGDALPSDIVAEELKKTAEKKPVIVSQGQVAGSGGYWISMYGDKIIASPWTITGSIGVIGGWFYDDGFNEKLGLDYDNVQAGAHADLGGGASLPLIGAGIPVRNLTPEERDRMEKSILEMYDGFVGKVADGRNMDKEEIAKIAQGRIWTGTDGKDIGLVDEIGGLEYSIKLAREAAGIKDKEKVNLVEMPGKGKFDPNMFRPKLFGMSLTNNSILTGDPNVEYIRMVLERNGKPLPMMTPDACVIPE